MIIGIDVGGTNTDAVLLEDFTIARKVKVPTTPDDLLSCVLSAFEQILEGRSCSDVKRIVLSTTLSTNAIVQGRLEPAGVIVSSGPGIDPAHYKTGPHYHMVDGSIDHRGREITPLDLRKVDECLKSLKEKGVTTLAAVSKFSTRNPSHEQAIKKMAKDSFSFVSTGHLLSGSLNFPRRIATSFLNASVWKLHHDFAGSVSECIRKKGITAPIYLLKADGGTMPVEDSTQYPVYTICSGPAASIMGLLALGPGKTFVGLDIGGTTTDISLFYKGAPLFVPHGISIGTFKTLIRGLLTCSIGMGGDSEVTVKDGRIDVGPHRKGPSMAAGGPAPALTDALIASGQVSLGDAARASEGMEKIAGTLGISKEEASSQAIARAVGHICSSVGALIEKVNSRPVYTIHEMLQGLKITPECVVAVGGPAQAIARPLEEGFSLPVIAPQNYEVANALGAALSRVTSELTLIADTEEGTLFAVEEDFHDSVEKRFSLSELKKLAIERMQKRATGQKPEEAARSFEFTEEHEFNMVRGFYTAGKNIRVKVQVKPGLIGTPKGVVTTC